MRVGDFVETREADMWGKKIRVVDNRTHTEIGKWYDNKIINKRVKSFKISKKYLFIFVWRKPRSLTISDLVIFFTNRRPHKIINIFGVTLAPAA